MDKDKIHFKISIKSINKLKLNSNIESDSLNQQLTPSEDKRSIWELPVMLDSNKQSKIFWPNVIIEVWRSPKQGSLENASP